MAKRSYGTGRLYVVVDRGGRASWYGSWWAGGTRVKRKRGLKRTPGNADGLTRTQAERELRRRVEATAVVAHGHRRTIGEAGEAYVTHPENVMERKRTTIADYRGYLRRHLAPFFGDRPMDRIDAAKVEAYLHAKRRDGLSPKTVQNHLNFLHGIFAFAIRRAWATANPVALVERPRAHRSAHRRIRFLQPEELEAVLRAVPVDTLGALERPLYLTAAMTGLRHGVRARHRAQTPYSSRVGCGHEIHGRIHSSIRAAHCLRSSQRSNAKLAGPFQARPRHSAPTSCPGCARGDVAVPSDAGRQAVRSTP